MKKGRDLLMAKRYKKDKSKSKLFLSIGISVLLLFVIAGVFYIYHSVNKYNERKKQEIEQKKAEEEEKKKEEADKEKNEDTTPVVTTPIVEETNIILSAVGDSTIGTDPKFYHATSLPAMVQQNNNDPSYLFSNVAHIFKEDDITIANLETTFTTATEKRDKGHKVQYHFKGDPELASSLVSASIEGVNLSNNHIYDYGQKGFDDTIDTLENLNVNYFGEEYKWVTEAKGIKFGFLGYQGWAASDSLLETIKNDIESLKKEVDIVVVSFHWGIERETTPNELQKTLAHYSIDNGADLIIGHHPHVIQGIEYYKGKYINYSLGNFCFGGNSNPTDKDTYIFQADFKFKDKKLSSVGIRVIPCSVSSVKNRNDYRPTPLAGDEKLRLLDRINSYKMNLDFELTDSFQYVDIQ